MNNLPQTEDLNVFIQVVKNGSFAKAADEIGMSPAYISKRIQILEDCLGVKLLNRTTRSLNITSHGLLVYEKGIDILLDIKNVVESISNQMNEPSGSLNITSSLGFGRQHVAPLISELSNKYPKLTIRFDTIDQILDLASEQIDLDIRVGNNIAPNLIARKLFSNRRILCATPDYLKKYGTPKKLDELSLHQCLIIKERDHPFGLWELDSKKGKVSVKVFGQLASNNGDLVKYWALHSHGIMLRSLWDINDELKHKELIQILPNYWQNADIWAVYPTRLSHSAKLRVCVDFLQSQLPQRLKHLQSH